ncbi:MAG TPA: GNAT family N-acetyltransferase [Thermoleophilaceae bacterium]|jgi:RimJ/RimL family protein N-acetyltransferase
MPEREAATSRAPARRWPERVTLRDGSEIAIRPIRKSDKKRLLEGFEQLSPESRYHRFLVPMPELAPRLVRYFTEIDHHDHEALVALGWESGEPIGVVRFVRSEEDPEAAEVAVAVVDHWQRRGVATELLKRIAVRAREEGISCFTATCLADNSEVLELFDSFGSTQILQSNSGLVEAKIDLPAEEELGIRAALRAAATKSLLFRPPASREAKPDWPPRRR